MAERREIATVFDYDGLQKALRDRAAEINVSRALLDELSGLQNGYCGKALALRPLRRLGAVSLGPLLGALGLALVIIEHPDQMERISARWVKRDSQKVRAETVHIFFSMRRFRAMQRKGGQNSRKYMTPEQASELGRKAAMARWRKPVVMTEIRPPP
jgi:hypothetical protein